MNSFNNGSTFWLLFFKGEISLNEKTFFSNWKKKLVYFEFLTCQISEEKPSKNERSPNSILSLTK
jgi:hypothetical protein